MAVAFVSSSTAANQTASTFSVTKPASAADGNWLVAFQETSLSSGGSAPAAPSGWSLLDRQGFNLATFDCACFIRQVSGDGASYTFNNASGGVAPVTNVRITCWSGAGTPTQISKNSGSGTTATATGLTTAAANSYLAGAYAAGTTLGSYTITPTDLTTLLTTIGGADGRLRVAYDPQAAAGASGNKAATISESQNWAALLVVIPPAATGRLSRTGSLDGLGGAGQQAFNPSLGV